jgi:PAS domain-containing protein
LSDEKISLLRNAVPLLPLPCAAWFLVGDEIFVTAPLLGVLQSSESPNFLAPLQFVRLCQAAFGNFLVTAVEAVSSSSTSNVTDYVSSVSLHESGKILTLRLIFYRKLQLYMLIVDDPKKTENNPLLSILDTLPLYIWQKNRDLQLIYCNKRYSDALETSKEAVLAKNLNLLANHKHNSLSSAHATNQFRAKKFNEHVVIKGDRRFLEVTELPGVGHSPITGFAIDVTNTEFLQKEYENYKKQTEETLDNVSIPIAICDEKIRLVFANVSFIKLFGSDWQGDYFGKNFADILDSLFENGTILNLDHKDQFKRIFLDLIEPYHATLHLKNDKFMNLNISPNPRGGGLIVICEDISDKVSLEREMNAIAAVQRETLRHLREGIIVFGSDIRIKITNPSFMTMWGVDEPKDVVGLHVQDFFELAKECFTSIEESKLLADNLINISIQRIEVADSFSLSNGKTFDYSYIPLPDGFHLLGFFDATDRANLEKTLREKIDIVARIDKLKDRLLENISLALRGPINTIVGFAEILEKNYFGILSEKQLRYCRGITASAKMLDETVETISKLAGLEAGNATLNRSEISIDHLIQEATNLYRSKSSALEVIVDAKAYDKSATLCVDESAMILAVFHTMCRLERIVATKGKIVISVNFIDDKIMELSIASEDLNASRGEITLLQRIVSSEPGASDTNNPNDFGILLANTIFNLHGAKLDISIDENNHLAILCRLSNIYSL